MKEDRLREIEEKYKDEIKQFLKLRQTDRIGETIDNPLTQNEWIWMRKGSSYITIDGSRIHLEVKVTKPNKYFKEGEIVFYERTTLMNDKEYKNKVKREKLFKIK